MAGFFLSDSRDQTILGITKGLAEQLGIRKFPQEIEWRDDFDGGGRFVVSSDDCFFYRNRLILAKRMQDKLEPKDWRSLLSSSLILHSKLQRRFVGKYLTRVILPPFLLFLLSIVLSARNVNSTMPFVAQDWFFVGFTAVTGFALILTPVLFFGPMLQDERLVADRMAAGLVGRQDFLATLNKIDQMKLEDVERSKGKHRRSTRVGIDRRISNLQGTFQEG